VFSNSGIYFKFLFQIGSVPNWYAGFKQVLEMQGAHITATQ
jgi:hypothetical protein